MNVAGDFTAAPCQRQPASDPECTRIYRCNAKPCKEICDTVFRKISWYRHNEQVLPGDILAVQYLNNYTFKRLYVFVEGIYGKGSFI